MFLPRFVPWVVLLFCAGAMAAISDAPGVPQVRVDVARHGDTWTADFNFDRPVAAWVFPRSDVTASDRPPVAPANLDRNAPAAYDCSAAVTTMCSRPSAGNCHGA